MLGALIPYPHWLNAGDNTWQLTAGVLVGLMSIPGIAVLYGGLVQKKWAVNTMFMAFTGFSLVLVCWVLFSFKMGFGNSWTGTGTGLLHNFIGHPGTVLSHEGLQSQANIPQVSGAGLMPPFRFPMSSLVWFQFVFAGITPLLFLGSVLGRMSVKAWMLFVPLWSTFVYTVNAFLLWGGGYWAQKGALDFSGGYVIHLAAGTSGFVAAAVIGPRLKRDREHAVPNNLLLVAVGAGIVWLGWSGFNGGDPYFAGADAAAAVLNTNLCTATALLTWVILDMVASPTKKPTFLGAINGMICGLVGITPAAGYVDGLGAILIGVIDCTIVFFAWYYLPKIRPFSKVDDALGVVYTHGIAGFFGGLLTGVFADPSMIVYVGTGKTASASTVPGLFFGHPWQVMIQLMAGLTIIVYDGIVTFILIKIVGFITPLRMPDDVLEIGDVAVHDEEVMPSEMLERVSSSRTESAYESAGKEAGR
ncbi:MAG TPA: ammonium transporter [Acidimicrobiales bacterium]|nr:ammonium transporter [Acidimicrobiales bacterium]